MKALLPRLSFCLLCALCLAGCSVFSSTGEMVRKSFASMKPGTGDYDDGTDEYDEGWIQEAGVEARGNRPVEIDNDPFRNILMSPKAKSIEKNLGIE